MASNGKYLVTIRHGERTDLAGMIPKLHILDPELTEFGCAQAMEAGQLLGCFFYNELGLRDKSKIAIISSPFARTLQTAKYVKKSLLSYNCDSYPIHVENRISEVVTQRFGNVRLREFLSIYNDSKILQQQLDDQNLVYISHMEDLPSLESDIDLSDRMRQALTSLTKDYLEKEYDILVLVSHGAPIDAINGECKYPGERGWRSIKYCASSIYKYDNAEFQYIKTLIPSQV